MSHMTSCVLYERNLSTSTELNN